MILLIYILGSISTYILLRLIKGRSEDWTEVLVRIFFYTFSWLSVAVIGFSELADKLENKKFKLFKIKPPKWL